jgi:hypothetical protein
MKKIILTLTTLLFIGNFLSFGQISVIENTNIDNAFPACYYYISKHFKVAPEEMDYGKGTLKTGYYYYSRVLLQQRGRFLVEVVNNNCQIKMVDIQYYNTSSKSWINDKPGTLVKKEFEFTEQVAKDAKQSLSNPEEVKGLKKWFFVDPYVFGLFCKSSTTLAIEKYFETYLKDVEVDWSMIYGDIKKTEPSESKDYKYRETYVTLNANGINQSFATTFYLNKYTNNEENVLLKSGTEKNVKGFCRELRNDGTGYYKLIVTDKLDTFSSPNSVQTEQNKSVLDNADKLIKLKELFDKGILSKEEYETEKAKLLK